MDNSGSMSTDLEDAKQFLANLVGEFTVGSNDVRVGTLHFSQDVTVVDLLGTNNDKTLLQVHYTGIDTKATHRGPQDSLL